MVGAICVYVIRAEAPKEFKTHSLKFRSIEQKQIGDLEKVLIPGGLLILGALLFVMGVNTGFILIVVGLIIAPIGFIGMIDDKNIDTSRPRLLPVHQDAGCDLRGHGRHGQRGH